jgi:alkylmercury lyase
MTDSERIERLAHALIAAVPHLDHNEQTVALALLRTLAQGEAVSERTLAAASGAPEIAIRRALDSWTVILRDGDGRISGFMGLSVEQFGEHRIEFGARTLTAWCGWDTLFLPELLGGPVRVRSRCPVTGEQISLIVGPDGPTHARPSGTVLSFLAPERPFDADIVSSFCHFVHFFASASAAAEWTEQHPGTFTISLEEAFTLGRRTNQATFASALRSVGAVA